METSPAHRKIELQSSEDFSYLISNVRRAAAAHIDEAFPPVARAGGPAGKNDGDEDGDELRTRIEALVDEYIVRTFTLAAPNLSVNGLPVADPGAFLSSGPAGRGGAAEPEEQHEPFDGRKRERVVQLAGQEEDLLREIAALKRKVPQAAARDWKERVASGIEGDERALEECKVRVERLVGEEDGLLLGGDVRPLERQEGVERAFGDAVRTLGQLKGDMPATVAKMERARVAGEYVITER
jgi:kinetochor protein Mis14/NSL1